MATHNFGGEMTRVLDAKGREWTIRERRTAWRPFLVLRLFRRDKLDPAPTRPTPRPPVTFGDRVVTVIAHLLSPELIVLMVILSPLLLLESVALLVATAGLWPARAAGFARRRVDVVGHTGPLIHSQTALLVRGPAAELIAEVAADRENAAKSFHPDGLDAQVRRHRSVWQSADEWR